MRSGAILGLLKLGTLAGGSAYLIIGVLAALEASAFVGLFVPGEVGVLAGGYIAYQGRASLIPMMIVATAGAIIGDSIGYEIGRHLGASIRRSRFGAKVGEERWAKAENYLAVKGGRAVFFGRFIGLLRALVPALAGVSKMRYRKFLFWNALGALIWAPTLVGLGYLAGSSYKRVEHYAGRAGLVLLALAVMIGGVAALGRWVSRHPERVRAFGQRILARPIPGRIHRRYHAQLGFVVRRLKPGRAVGLALTLQLIALGLAGWAFGSVVQDVVSGDAGRFDMDLTKNLLERRVGWLTTVMSAVTHLGGAAVLVPLVVVVGLVARRFSGSWAPLVILVVGVVGGILLSDVVKPLVGRNRPALPGAMHGDGFAFPSGHATQSVAAYGGLAYLAAGWFRTWAAKVAVWTMALALVLVIGFSRIYLGLHWTTDVLGGYALGAAWLAAVLVTTSAVQGALGRHTPPPPGGEEATVGSAARGEIA
jgi:undecaprenyl-diphosphatase